MINVDAALRQPKFNAKSTDKQLVQDCEGSKRDRDSWPRGRLASKASL
jgi:hypothetical protein